MSGTSQTPPRSPYPTRTVGIIKNHALKHRLTIERRIIDAGFDIVKERQMEFSADSDRDVLEDLFGNDAVALTEDPVWVYVLERHRAIETLHSLMGDEDPQEARINAPQSIRAIYGVDEVNNAFGGSLDSAAAEAQIAALFASSPPFPTSELPSPGRDITSSVLDELRSSEEPSDAAYYASSVRTSNAGSTSSTRKEKPKDGKPVFRARPVPATNAVGSVAPRMTKAAALRIGITLPSMKRQSLPAQPKRDFIDVPGHKRSEVIAVASTAAPVIAPRATRASSLREGKPVTVSKPRQSLNPSRDTFKNVPGHKRSETIEVSSVKAPVVAPRSNRSASLRQVGPAPPSSFMFKGPVEPKVPGNLTSRASASSLSSQGEGATRSDSKTTTSPPARPSSQQGYRPPSSMGDPTIAPRSNRSAMLRAAKQAATGPATTRV